MAHKKNSHWAKTKTQHVKGWAYEKLAKNSGSGEDEKLTRMTHSSTNKTLDLRGNDRSSDLRASTWKNAFRECKNDKWEMDQVVAFGADDTVMWKKLMMQQFPRTIHEAQSLESSVILDEYKKVILLIKVFLYKKYYFEWIKITSKIWSNHEIETIIIIIIINNELYNTSCSNDRKRRWQANSHKKAKKKSNEKITLQPRHNFTHQALQPLVRTQLIALGIFTSLRSDLGYKCQSRGGLKRFSLLSSYFPKGVLTDH